jgi:hypothetical protein
MGTADIPNPNNSTESRQQRFNVTHLPPSSLLRKSVSVFTNYPTLASFLSFSTDDFTYFTENKVHQADPSAPASTWCIAFPSIFMDKEPLLCT